MKSNFSCDETHVRLITIEIALHHMCFFVDFAYWASTIENFILKFYILLLCIEPSVGFVASEYTIVESIGILRIPIQRKGDPKDVTSLYCFTQSGECLYHCGEVYFIHTHLYVFFD